MGNMHRVKIAFIFIGLLFIALCCNFKKTDYSSYQLKIIWCRDFEADTDNLLELMTTLCLDTFSVKSQELCHIPNRGSYLYNIGKNDSFPLFVQNVVDSRYSSIPGSTDYNVIVKGYKRGLRNSIISFLNSMEESNITQIVDSGMNAILNKLKFNNSARYLFVYSSEVNDGIKQFLFEGDYYTIHHKPKEIASQISDSFRINGEKNVIILINPPYSTPGVPVLASPTNGSVNQPTALTMNWELASSAASYSIIVSIESDFASTVYSRTDLLGSSAIVSGLERNERYYWEVSAANLGGTSAWSGVWSFITKPKEIKSNKKMSVYTQHQTSNGELVDSAVYEAKHVVPKPISPKLSDDYACAAIVKRVLNEDNPKYHCKGQPCDGEPCVAHFCSLCKNYYYSKVFCYTLKVQNMPDSIVRDTLFISTKCTKSMTHFHDNRVFDTASCTCVSAGDEDSAVYQPHVNQEHP